jgi:hypothetical protein
MQLGKVQAYRKSLLPTWIRFFSWGFLIGALAIPLVFAYGIIWPDESYINIFGLSFAGPTYHPFAILLQSLILFFGVTAYGLLWGKRWGIDAGILCGFLASVISISTTVNALLHSRSYVEFSILLAIPFVIRLFKIRDKWVAPELPERHAIMDPG